MDPLPRPSDSELVDLLEQEREAVHQAGRAAPGRTGGARLALHVEAALPLEAFLREIDESTT